MLDRFGIRLLGCCVLSAQLPLMFHVPWWLSLPMLAVIATRTMTHRAGVVLTQPLITGSLTLAGVVAIYLVYGGLLSRDPCVAFLFMLSGFKFAETQRKKDGDLLVLICLFLLMTQFFYWQTLSAALLSLPAIMSITMAMQYLQRHPQSTTPKKLARTTSRLLLQGMPLAVILFLAVPRMQAGGWGSEGSAVTGLSDRLSIGSVSQLVKSEEVAMRVEFDGAIPHTSNLYWRGPVLSGFDGINWFSLPGQQRSGKQNLRTPANEVNTNAITYRVTMTPSFQRWLPTLDTPVDAPELSNQVIPARNEFSGSTINRERVSYAPQTIRKPVRYRAQSIVTDKNRTGHSPGPEYLITTVTNPRSKLFASQLRARYRNNHQLIQAVLNWYNQEGYIYTLNPTALPDDDAIDKFLFGSKEGFCEHYASSFVFLLRAAGIPARIVTGYQGGDLNDDYLIVRQSDAHAWAEAYIDNSWIRIDPTAAVAPERVERGAGALDHLHDNYRLKALWPKFLSMKLDSLNYYWQKRVIDFDNQSRRYLLERLGISKFHPSMLVAAFFAIVLGATVFFTGCLNIRRKQGSPVAKQWALFIRDFTSIGFAKAPGETAATYVERLQQNWPNQRQLLQQFINQYTTAHYGPKASSEFVTPRIQAAGLRKTRRLLRKQMDAVCKLKS